MTAVVDIKYMSMQSHIFHYERGSIFAFGGAVMHTVRTTGHNASPRCCLKFNFTIPAFETVWSTPGSSHFACQGFVLEPRRVDT